MPATAAGRVLCSDMVNASLIETWYAADVVRPPTAVCPFGLYMTLSPSLNLWNVENATVLLDRFTNPALCIALNSTECSTEDKLGFAFAPLPLPPVIVIIGSSI